MSALHLLDRAIAALDLIDAQRRPPTATEAALIKQAIEEARNVARDEREREAIDEEGEEWKRS